jgi:hypothetical protein
MCGGVCAACHLWSGRMEMIVSVSATDHPVPLCYGDGDGDDVDVASPEMVSSPSSSSHHELELELERGAEHGRLRVDPSSERDDGPASFLVSAASTTAATASDERDSEIISPDTDDSAEQWDAFAPTVKVYRLNDDVTWEERMCGVMHVRCRAAEHVLDFSVSSPHDAEADVLAEDFRFTVPLGAPFTCEQGSIMIWNSTKGSVNVSDVAFSFSTDADCASMQELIDQWRSRLTPGASTCNVV